MNRYCPGCRRTRRFLATDSHGWVCEGCNYQLAQCGEWIASVCRCGARIEGLGASAHAWGVQDHERKCAAGGGEGE